MKSLRQLLIFFVLILFSQHAHAQWLRNVIDTLQHKRQEQIAITDKWHTSGTFASYLQLQNTQLSPLIYSGPGGGVSWHTQRYTPTWHQITGVHVFYHYLLGPETLESMMHFPGGYFATVWLRNTRWPGISLGGSLRAGYEGSIYSKLGNDAEHGNGLASLALAGQWRYGFTLLKRPADVYARLQLPLASYLNRYPQFNIREMEHHFMPLGRLNQLVFTAQLVHNRKHSQENRVSVAYQWRYYHYDFTEQKQQNTTAQHWLTFSFWMKTM